MHNQQKPKQNGTRGSQSTSGMRSSQSSKQLGKNNQTNPQKTKKRKSAKNHWLIALVMALATLAACILMAAVSVQLAFDLFGLNQEAHEYNVTIPEGADEKQVADILEKTGVIENSFVFKTYTGLKSDIVINPGEYVFNSNQSYDQIIVALKIGDIKKQIVTITFVEGLTLEDIANELEENNVCKAKDFMDYLDSEKFTYDFADEVPDDVLRFHQLEGYIFPDTYEFYVGEKLKSIADKFLTNFENKFTNKYRTRMERIGMTLDETMTLASVIQKEAGKPEEMVLVSSVFHNRLDNSKVFPNLQSDVTVFYVNDYIKPHMGNSPNQEMYDAYNTYKTTGLPIAPICNPGIRAIDAALNPVKTEYYYFVTDIKGEYYFSTTLAGHDQKVKEAEAVTDDKGKSSAHGIGTIEPETEEAK